MNRLYGGSNAKYGESPWSVIIHYDMPYNKRGKFVSSAYWECGGTIIHKQWVLTAASCNFWPGDKDNPSASNYYRIRVQFMDVMRRTAIKTMTVPTKNVYRHPDYVYQSDTHSRYDIALYKLPWELDIDIWDGVTVPLVNTPVCLPNNASVYYNRELTTMFGWGVYNTYIYRYNFISLFEWEIQPDIMQKVDFVLSPHNECPEGLLCSKPSESMFVKPTGCDDDKGSALVQYTDAYRSRAILVGVYIGRTLIKGTKGCKDNTKSMLY
ncbi:venom peptide isomerase heavy chain-like [Oppia nitens]|uniref:venom peptide isomerase heavy chain-like n=1 Tax=Oppia nitens TaxID=1686743 RepID=UPI0023D997FD|nr:venom peptide isomerase heavy chain-like [Oppia nitens]